MGKFIYLKEFMNRFELVTELHEPPGIEAIIAEIDKINDKKYSLLDEKEIEERNDVFIYNTIKYPPKSTPPTAN